MKFRLLALAAIAASCLTIAVQAQSPQKLKIPDEITAELKDDPIDFELTSPETTVIQVTLSSEAFDTYLELLDAKGNTLGQNDDGGDNTGAVLTFLAEADTTYTVRARSYYTGSTGEFTLTVAEPGASDVSFDQSASTDLKTKPQLFTFTGKADDEVDFVVKAEDYDTTLALLDAYGNTLTTSDDGDGLNPFISDFLLPADGTYILKLSAYSDEVPENPVEISARPTTIQDLAFDKPMANEQDKSYLRFEAEAGTTYRVEVRAKEASNLSAEIKIRGNDSVEVSGSSYGTNSLTFEFTPTTDGFYKLTINGVSSSYESTPYTTTISEVK
jgi:hypothetical protein